MKYKNISEFKQIAVINGKKEIVAPGIVIEVDRELIHPAFEKVAENSEVNYKKLTPKLVKNDSLESLKKQVLEMQDATATNKKSNEVAELAKMCEEQFKTIFKRLEILKNAVQTIELEVEQALYGEDGDSKS